MENYKIKTFVIEDLYKIVFNGHENHLLLMNHPELRKLSDDLVVRHLEKSNLILKKKSIVEALKNNNNTKDIKKLQAQINNIYKEVGILSYCISYLRDFMFSIENVKMVKGNEFRILASIQEEEIPLMRENGWKFKNPRDQKVYSDLLMIHYVDNLFSLDNTKVKNLKNAIKII